ncbi:MAG: 4-(cytidine 5'-diphospho)-2-C-methyl-D-erythritol kinase [Proteobacteria bacterium]|nr:MAG: 4-(cytidine 5'-diphospho)-2-C-methyl-D-erythritol kinase [Pseudomonadota bacterium]
MRKKAYAKVNIFLKIVGKRGNYHELLSRFMRVDSLYDELILKEKTSKDEFELVGDFTCEYENNTIVRAYKALKQSGFEEPLKSFFKDKSLHVEKNIPSFAGLGGGSSDGASFLLLCNESMGLGLGKNELVNIGLKVGADVPFFIHEYKSANVKGIGDIVEEFEEDLLDFEILTPPIQCSTAEVFKNFSAKFDLGNINKAWQNCSSKALLENFDGKSLNDLCKSAFDLYPALNDYYKKGYFMSGSGSSMFRIKNG